VAEKPETCTAGDEIQLGPKIGEDSYICLRHKPDHREELGIVRPAKDGEPIQNNTLIFVEPKDQANGTFHVRDSIEPAQVPIGKPAKVTTEAFRTGWDAVWGHPTVGQA
jgi:hypothetical protein